MCIRDRGGPWPTAAINLHVSNGGPRPTLRLFQFRRGSRCYNLRRQQRAQLVLDVLGDSRVVLQVLARVVLALADAFAAVAVPGAGLVDDLVVAAHVDQFALTADALAVEDLGDDLLERRRELVLDDLDARLVADDFLALLDRADAADVEPNRCIE